MRRLTGLALLAGLVGVGACPKSGTQAIDYGTLGCLDGWPSTPSGPPSMVALSVTPSVLWQTQLGLTDPPIYPGVALSGDRVIAAGGASWAALDRLTGKRLFVTNGTDPSNFGFGPPAVGPDGAIYVQSDVALHAYEVDGSNRWGRLLSSQQGSSEPHPGTVSPIVVSSSMVLAYDGTGMGAYNAADGTLPWTSTSWSVGATAGHWGWGGDGVATFFVDLRTGKRAGRLRSGGGSDVIPLVPIAGKGLIAVDNDNSFGLQVLLFDICGKEMWRVQVNSTRLCPHAANAVVSAAGITYLPIDACGDAVPQPQIVAIDPNGHIVAGPTPMPQRPVAVGADGTVYVADFKAADTATNLIALAADLKVAWRLPLGAALAFGATAAMANDGIMYLQTSKAGANTVTAVQTTSPGLAAGAWSAIKADGRASSWAGGQY